MKERTSTALFLLLYGLTVLGALTGMRPLLLVAAASMALYVMLVLGSVLRRNILVALVLMAIGVGLAASNEDPVQVLLNGAVRNLPFMVLIGASMMLRHPAAASLDMRTIGAWIDVQPPGRRFSVVAGASHIFGAVLNQAAIVLVAGFLSGWDNPEVRRRRTVTIMRGFMGSIFWSPLFVATAVALTVVPGSSWIEIVPFGIAASVAVFVCAWMVDRWNRAPAADDPDVHAGLPTNPVPAIARIGVLFVCLAGSVVVAFEALGIPIPIAIGLIAPPVAVLWSLASTAPGELRDGLRGVMKSMADLPPSLGNETVLFLGANVFGQGVASALDPASVSVLIGFLPSALPLQIAVLIVLGVLMCAAGLHPVVFMMLIGEGLTSQGLGIEPSLLAAMLVMVWSLGVTVSPVAATTLQIARLIGESSYRIAWIWNGPFAVLATGVVAAMIGGYLACVG